MLAASATVEPAAAADAAAIVDLLQRAGLPSADLNPAALRDFWVVRDGDHVVGTVGLEVHGGDGLLRSLAVAPVARGRGLGRALVTAVEQQARAQGLHSLTLLTQTAAPFFAALGYGAVARNTVDAALQVSPQFTSLCPASASCLRKFFTR
jgi:amino-acid N-acetyltransferase